MASRLALIVHDHSAETVEPGKGALSYPALGDRHEAASAIVAIGGMHNYLPDSPARIAKHLALASIDALMGIQAPLLAQARGQFDTLGIYQRQ